MRAARLLGHVVLGALAAHTLLPLLQRFGHRPLHAQALVRWWNRRLLAILNVRLEMEGRIHAGPTLFVANHISWLDIPVLRAVADVAFVSKDEVRRWPLVGSMAARAGTIFMCRGQRDAAAQTAERMAWVLQGRCQVLLFPEGTTTDGRGLRPFHARLYQAAIHTHTHVQAVALTYPHEAGVHPAAPYVGDIPLARHLWQLLGQPGLSAKLSFCAPLVANHQNRRELAHTTREQIRTALGHPTPASVHTDVIAV
jgi:1-acyl-sn-glycerol-3-phosphate acyltransferase